MEADKSGLQERWRVFIQVSRATQHLVFHVIQLLLLDKLVFLKQYYSEIPPNFFFFRKFHLKGESKNHKLNLQHFQSHESPQ